MSSVDLAHTPAASPPPGIISNLDNPITLDQKPSIVLGIFGIIVATMFMAMRAYTKAFLAHMFGLDDVFLICSWAMSMVVQITIVWMKMNNLIGKHIWDTSIKDFKTIARITNICSIIYLILMAFAKFSILMFYKRLSPQTWFRYAVNGMITIIVGFTVPLMLMLMFACVPLKKIWDPTVTEGHCIEIGNVYMATAGTSAATDIIMLVRPMFLPMPMLLRLQIPTIQKIGVVLIFSVGSVTMATSLVRLSIMPPLIVMTDMPWSLSVPATWICVEGSLIIICGCLPILRLFLKHTCPRLIREYGTAGTARSRGLRAPTMESAELRNLERSILRRSKRCSRVTDLMQSATSVRNENGSETSIIVRDKNDITVENVELGNHRGSIGKGDRTSTELTEHAMPERSCREICDGSGVCSDPPDGHSEAQGRPLS